MKFGKDFKHQMVPEWVDAYMDYTSLKHILRELRFFKEANKATQTPLRSIQQLSFSKALTGLSPLYKGGSPNVRKQVQRRGKSPGDVEDQVISVSSEPGESSSRTLYRTNLLKTPIEGEGGEYEVNFFRKLDEELNKVNEFYRDKVAGVMREAAELGRQMNAFIALRIKVQSPSPIVSELVAKGEHSGASDNSDDINNDACSSSENVDTANSSDMTDPFEILGRVRIKNDTSAIKSILKYSKEKVLSFNKDELKEVEERLRIAFVEFYNKLRLLKNFSYMNLAAFSKIMKKYEKITSRAAARSYMKIVDKSYLGSSEQVNILLERVEDIFVKHFFNANRKKGMKLLRQRKRIPQHRITFFSGFFSGCIVALLIAIILIAESRKLIIQRAVVFMDNMFQTYSLFAFIVLHIFMYAADTYFWRRYRINYPFIFNFKQGTELGYREVFLLGSGLAVLGLGSFLVNFHLVMRLGATATTRDHMTFPKLIPLGLAIVVLGITLCPFNIMYRSSRFFFLKTLFRCICAPFYVVTLPDFFLADQLTSQVQAIRSIEFFICFYSRGGLSQSQSKCHENDVYNAFYFIVALIPYWIRCLQCLRRLVEERDGTQGLNAVKYLLTIIAVIIRTVYELKEERAWLILSLLSSAIAVMMNIYWDLVVDWGLMRWRSKNFLLRDKLMVSHKSVYFIAMAINVLLRVAWLQLVLEFNVVTLQKTAISTTISCLEIVRRGMWSFFRLENEHLNNVGKYRAFRSVPLPFNYYDEKTEDDDKEE